MILDPAFSYALQYFDGLTGSFYPTALLIAQWMCLFGILWQCIQIVFGTLEVRKFAVGTITKFFLFWVVISYYPFACVWLRAFALKLGQDANTETGSRACTMLVNRMNQLESESGALKAVAGGGKNATTEAFDGAIDTKIEGWETIFKPVGQIDIHVSKGSQLSESQRRDALEKAEELHNTAQSIRKIVKKDKEGKYYLELGLPVIKNPDKADASTVTSVDRDDDSGEKKIVTAYRKGMLSLDTIFKFAYLTAEVMLDRTYDRNILLASEGNQAVYDSFATSYNKAKKNGKDIADADAMFNAAAAIGKVDLNLLQVPLKALVGYGLTFVCAVFVVIVTCICLIQYAMHMVEYNIVTGFSILLIPMALFDGLKDYAVKIIGMLLSESIKLAMVVMMMYYNVALFGAMADKIMTSKSAFGIADFGFVVFSALMGLALISNAPKLASVIMTGQPQMSMGEFVAAAGGIAGGVAAGRMAVTRTVGTAAKPVAFAGRTGINMRNAYKDVRAAGGSKGQAWASALGNGALSSAASMLSVLSGGRAGGPVKGPVHLSEMAKTGAEKRQMDIRNKASNLSSGSGGNSGMFNSGMSGSGRSGASDSEQNKNTGSNHFDSGASNLSSAGQKKSAGSNSSGSRMTENP